MDYAKGTVVRSIKGHDKDKLFVIKEISGDYVYIIDGKCRKKQNPKKKSIKHIVKTQEVIPETDMLSDKRIRYQLNRLKRNFGGDFPWQKKM